MVPPDTGPGKYCGISPTPDAANIPGGVRQTDDPFAARQAAGLPFADAEPPAEEHACAR